MILTGKEVFVRDTEDRVNKIMTWHNDDLKRKEVAAGGRDFYYRNSFSKMVVFI